MQPAEPTTQIADLGFIYQFFWAGCISWKQYATLLRLRSQMRQNGINTQVLKACEVLTVIKFSFSHIKFCKIIQKLVLKHSSAGC